MPKVMPDYIPSPYNFARVWENVLFYRDVESSRNGTPAVSPDHDTPLEHGLCGHLDVTLTSTTPVYVRAEGKHDAKAIRETLKRANGWVAKLNQEEQSKLRAWGAFYRLPDGREALPATTVKGMIRNVLEIATFSKMSAVLNDRYGVRDLKTKDTAIYKDWMTETTTSPSGGPAFRPRTRAAWLVQRNNEWFLQSCAHWRVEHSVLRTLAESGNNSPWLREIHGHAQDQTQAKDMYKAWAENVVENRRVAQREHALSVCGTLQPEAAHISHTAPGKLLFCEATNLSFATPGTHHLVFTGRIRNGNKHREFVFPAFNPNGSLHRVPDGRDLSSGGEEPDVRGDFEFIHQDSKDWTGYWKQKLAAGLPVPVFYLAYDHPPEPGHASIEFDGTNHLHSIGLSQMYRLAYRFRVRELLPPDHQRPDLDITQAIFGTVGKGSACLRGRVQCEPFPVAGKVTHCDDGAICVLSAPKPTYYPNYIEQDTTDSGEKLAGGTYHTLQTPPPEGRLRGWKRYPVRQDNSLTVPEPNLPPNANYGVATAFKPLAAGNSFAGHIHFHNLMPWELGALIWALRFGWAGDLKDSPYRHSVGMAKPLGCGGLKLTEVRVHAQDVESQTVHDQQNVWMQAFESKVNDWLVANPVGSIPPGVISEAEPVLQMRAMASQKELRDPGLLTYPRHPTNARDNVKMFGEYKAARVVLPRYTQLPKL